MTGVCCKSLGSTGTVDGVRRVATAVGLETGAKTGAKTGAFGDVRFLRGSFAGEAAVSSESGGSLGLLRAEPTAVVFANAGNGAVGSGGCEAKGLGGRGWSEVGVAVAVEVGREGSGGNVTAE